MGRRIAAGDRSYFYGGEHIILSFRKTSLSDYADIQFYTHSDVTDDVVALTGQDPSVTPFFASNLRPDTASAYYHTDHQGSVRAITDDSGAILNEYSYTAYGNEEAAAEVLLQSWVSAAVGTVPAFANLAMIHWIN